MCVWKQSQIPPNNFPGGACPRTPLVCHMLCTRLHSCPPIIHTISFGSLPGQKAERNPANRTCVKWPLVIPHTHTVSYWPGNETTNAQVWILFRCFVNQACLNLFNLQMRQIGKQFSKLQPLVIARVLRQVWRRGCGRAPCLDHNLIEQLFGVQLVQC